MALFRRTNAAKLQTEYHSLRAQFDAKTKEYAELVKEANRWSKQGNEGEASTWAAHARKRMQEADKLWKKISKLGPKIAKVEEKNAARNAEKMKKQIGNAERLIRIGSKELRSPNPETRRKGKYQFNRGRQLFQIPELNQAIEEHRSAAKKKEKIDSINWGAGHYREPTRENALALPRARVHRAQEKYNQSKKGINEEYMWHNRGRELTQSPDISTRNRGLKQMNIADARIRAHFENQQELTQAKEQVEAIKAHWKRPAWYARAAHRLSFHLQRLRRRAA